MKTITKIEANRSAAVHRKCRVAAYCRVSTEHDDQIESLGTQKEHYAAWIKLHTEWESAGIFYDAGITGTKAEIRPGTARPFTGLPHGQGRPHSGEIHQSVFQKYGGVPRSCSGTIRNWGFRFSLKKKT